MSSGPASTTRVREASQELPGAGDTRATLLHAFAEGAVRADHFRGERRPIVDKVDDAVVGSITAAALRVPDDDPVVIPLGETTLWNIEHQLDLLAGGFRVALESAEEPADSRGWVAPPSVGRRAHDVVPVDEEPGSAVGPHARTLRRADTVRSDDGGRHGDNISSQCGP
jgi:hypothetical protein